MGNIGEAAFSQGDVMRRLRLLERKLEELTAGRRLEHAAIGEGGIRIHSGGSLTVEGSGNVSVSEGSFRILDSAGEFLANVVPVAFDTAIGTSNSFSLPANPAQSDQAAATLTVPSWADEAIVICACNAQAENNRAVGDYLGIEARIDGVLSGPGGFFWAEPNIFAAGTVVGSRIVSNPGATIVCHAAVNGAGGVWASDPANSADTSATAIFRRTS